MYSGFVTPKRAVRSIGIHQRFDRSAYRMIKPFLTSGGPFPAIRQILHFEGVNGPDGIKVKSLGHHDPSHMYDPETDTGVLPSLLESHYKGLVSALRAHDRVRAAFEAAWLAHYVADGLTPAHHYPYDEKKSELFGPESEVGRFRRHWEWLGGKGVLSTHMNFEMGVAATLLLCRIRPKFDNSELSAARRIGPVEYFKLVARSVNQLDLYDKFYRFGWNFDIAQAVRRVIAPATAQAIGIIWLLAELESGMHGALQDLAGVS